MQTLTKPVGSKPTPTPGCSSKPSAPSRPQLVLSAPPRGPWEHTAKHLPPDQGRFICPITGLRFYPIPDGRGNILAVPGVTSVLSFQQSEDEIQRLANWRAKEEQAGRDPNAGRKRGSAVHVLLENLIRGDRHLHTITESSHTELTAYASGMEKYLRPYRSFLWNERPLRKGWEYTWSLPDKEGRRLARVWSQRWGFAGTPDLIAQRTWGKRGGLINVVGDFKSSNRPYYRSPGTPIPQHHRTGYLKYCKTVLQLGGYAIAIEETLGIPIHQGQIIVGLPEIGKAQMFHILPQELGVAKERFRQHCVAFWRTLPALRQS